MQFDQTKCQCLTKNGTQCRLKPSNKKGENPLFCSRHHQNCQTSLFLAKEKREDKTQIGEQAKELTQKPTEEAMLGYERLLMSIKPTYMIQDFRSSREKHIDVLRYLRNMNIVIDGNIKTKYKKIVIIPVLMTDGFGDFAWTQLLVDIFCEIGYTLDNITVIAHAYDFMFTQFNKFIQNLYKEVKPYSDVYKYISIPQQSKNDFISSVKKYATYMKNSINELNNPTMSINEVSQIVDQLCNILKISSVTDQPSQDSIAITPRFAAMMELMEEFGLVYRYMSRIEYGKKRNRIIFSYNGQLDFRFSHPEKCEIGIYINDELLNFGMDTLIINFMSNFEHQRTMFEYGTVCPNFIPLLEGSRDEALTSALHFNSIGIVFPNQYIEIINTNKKLFLEKNIPIYTAGQHSFDKYGYYYFAAVGQITGYSDEGDLMSCIKFALFIQILMEYCDQYHQDDKNVYILSPIKLRTCLQKYQSQLDKIISMEILKDSITITNHQHPCHVLFFQPMENIVYNKLIYSTNDIVYMSGDLGAQNALTLGKIIIHDCVNHKKPFVKNYEFFLSEILDECMGDLSMMCRVLDNKAQPIDKQQLQYIIEDLQCITNNMHKLRKFIGYAYNNYNFRTNFIKLLSLVVTGKLQPLYTMFNDKGYKRPIFQMELK